MSKIIIIGSNESMGDIADPHMAEILSAQLFDGAEVERHTCAAAGLRTLADLPQREDLREIKAVVFDQTMRMATTAADIEDPVFERFPKVKAAYTSSSRVGRVGTSMATSLPADLTVDRYIYAPLGNITLHLCPEEAACLKGVVSMDRGRFKIEAPSGFIRNPNAGQGRSYFLDDPAIRR